MHAAQARSWRLAAAAFLAVLMPYASPAQQPPVTVRGLAYDSLRSEPLSGAVIAVSGTGRTTVTDRRGRFEIDSVAPGSHIVTMNHDALDSLGLTGVSTRVDVTDGRTEIRLAVPSVGAFWKSACGRGAPRDSILVYGTVRLAKDQAPLANATVELGWIDLAVKGKKQVVQQMQSLKAVTDANGGYGFCGVPNATRFRIRASTATAASGVIDLAPSADRVRWRDLGVGPLLVLDSSQVGTISGVVLRAAGVPLANARVVVDGAADVRSSADGRFTLRNLPVGTRQFQVTAVGLDPVTRIVDVAVGRTTEVVVLAEKVTTLAAMRITGPPFIRRMAEGIAERKTLAFGVFLDSTDFMGKGTIRSAFDGAAGITVRPNGRDYILVLKESAATDCAANLFVDGTRQPDHERLWSLRPDEIKAVEIYRRGSTVPPEFTVTRSTCGAVAVWTRRTFP